MSLFQKITVIRDDYPFDKVLQFGQSQEFSRNFFFFVLLFSPQLIYCSKTNTWETECFEWYNYILVIVQATVNLIPEMFFVLLFLKEG